MEILTFKSHLTHDSSELFCVGLERTQMNEKALRDDGDTAYKMIDCINFAKLSLYSVNTAPVCKICKLRSCCKEEKNKNRMMLEYLYWISFYCTWWGRWICLILWSFDKSSKENGKVLRFKWETPLKICLLSTFPHCRKGQFFTC